MFQTQNRQAVDSTPTTPRRRTSRKEVCGGGQADNSKNNNKKTRIQSEVTARRKPRATRWEEGVGGTRYRGRGAPGPAFRGGVPASGAWFSCILCRAPSCAWWLSWAPGLRASRGPEPASGGASGDPENSRACVHLLTPLPGLETGNPGRRSPGFESQQLETRCEALSHNSWLLPTERDFVNTQHWNILFTRTLLTTGSHVAPRVPSRGFVLVPSNP